MVIYTLGTSEILGDGNTCAGSEFQDLTARQRKEEHISTTLMRYLQGRYMISCRRREKEGAIGRAFHNTLEHISLYFEFTSFYLLILLLLKSA